MKNTSIYAFKGIAAIFVVFIHCVFPGRLGVYAKMLARFAVPLFFLYSGYFGFGASDVKLRKAALRLLRMGMLLFCVYFLFDGYVALQAGIPLPAYVKSCLSADKILSWAIANEPPAGTHLWYLFALTYCYGLLMLLQRKGWIAKAYWAIPALLIVQLALDAGLAAAHVILPNWSVRNYALLGLPFFLLGHLIHARSEAVNRIKWLNTRNLCLLIVLGVLLLPLQYRISSRRCELYVSSVIICLALMLLSLRRPAAFSGTWLMKFGETYSLPFYLYHNIIIGLSNVLGTRAGLERHAAFEYAQPVAVCLLTFAAIFAFKAIATRHRRQRGIGMSA